MALTDTNVSPRPAGEERPGRIGAHIALVIVLLTTMLSYPQASRANSNPNNQPDQQHYNINVPQLNAAHALNRLAEQTGVTFLFPYSVAETQQANPVVGHFTLMQALKMLLQNTALSGGLTDSGVVVISRNDLNENGKGKRMNIKNKRNLLATFVTMFASGAMAQGVDGDQQAATQQSSIDEIVVTAQKKEERLLDVPISISVVDDEFIANAGISNLADLAYAVPNLSVIESSPGVLSAAIRGVTNSSGNAPLTGIYLDEIPLSVTIATSVNVETIDIERVEVLKGPQGTFYGQGSVGGTIRFIAKEPSFDGIEGRIGGSAYGTKDGDSSGEFTGVLNLPVIDDTLAFRVAATYKDRGGWIDHLGSNNGDANDSELSNIRIKGLWQISDDFTANLTAIRHRSEEGASNEINIGVVSDSNFQPVVRNGLGFPATGIDYQYDLYNITLSYDLGFATFTSSSSLTDVELLEMSRQSLVPSTTVIQDSVASADSYSQELRLAGTSNAIDWVIGGFYADSEENQAFANASVYAGGDVLFGFSNFESAISSKSTAIFGNVSYHLNDQLTVSLGGRSYEDDRSTEVPLFGVSKSGKFDNVSMKGSIAYAPSESSNVYFSVSEGFRSGGFNNFSDLTYDPESMISYEIGTKTRMLDGRLSVEAAIYHSQYDDYIGLINLPIGVNIQNPGDAEIQGIEWSTQLHVNELMSLGFNANFTDTEFTKASTDPVVVLVGDPLDNIPKYSYSINADFDFNWSSSTAGFAHINFNRQGPSTVTNRTVTALTLETSDINLLNAQIGAEWQQLTIRIFGRNLTNELRANKQSLASTFTQNRPRTLGVSFTYDF